MTPEQLKVSILQAAIQGKLVEQNLNDIAVNKLLTSNSIIREEYMAKNKIKKSKPLPEIEDEEIPFNIPVNWEWVRLGNYCIDIFSGKSPKYSKTPTEYKVIGQASNHPTGLDYSQIKYTNEDFWDDMPQRYFVRKYDVLLNTLGNGTLGRSGIITDLPFPLLTDGHLFVFRFDNEVEAKYLFYYLQYKRNEIEKAANGSTNQTFLSLSNTIQWLLPVPPLEEQHRIVAKIEQLLPYVDRYAASYEKLEQFNAKFPEEMKKSILQYAIQGKLVEQRPEEGTAEELYQQIQEERKGYKIKELSVDAIDDVPFDIPDTWKWIHLQDIVKKTIKRGKSPKYTEKSNVQVFAQKCNVKSGGMNMGLALFLDEDTVEKYPVEEYMCNGDIVINSTGGGTMGRVGIFHDTDRIDNMSIVPDGHVTIIRACDTVDYKYLYYIIKHKQRYLETQGEGSTNQTELKPLTIASLVIPLPPLAEQHRIVAKIEELLPYCDKLANKG